MVLKVQEQSPEIKALAEDWPIADALIGGTRAMRAAGRTFLPAWPNESEVSYEARRKTATLYPSFSRTIGVMGAKPFAKQLTLGDDVPAQVATWCEDCDLQGNNLHSFATDLATEALGYGLCGVLVDYPKTDPTAVKTLADEMAIGARPYLVLIRHSQLLGYKVARVNGAAALTQLRLAETAEVSDGGEFGVAYVKRVRVLEPTQWSLYEEGSKGEYTLIEQGANTVGVVPFVPFYGRRRGFMDGVSPLIDLAYLNVKHWQSQSDQDTILHVARVPILAAIGVDEDAQFALTVGASAAVRMPIGGELKFVEHTGAAIQAGEMSLEKLEAQMVMTGAEMLVIKPGPQKSATQSNNDAEANKSDLQRIVEIFEDGLDQVLSLLAKWGGEAEGGSVSLYKDFGAGSLSDASAQLILSLQQGGIITKKTALIEEQRRGLLSADIDPDEELDAVEAEGPPLALLGLMGQPGQKPGLNEEDPEEDEPIIKKPAKTASKAAE